MEQQFLTDSAIEWRLLFEISEEEDKASRGMSKNLKNVFCITSVLFDCAPEIPTAKYSID